MPSDKDKEQASFFANRVAKRDRHLGRAMRRAGTECYRVYDRDIPEVPLALDRYGDAAVLYLYERPYDKPEDEELAWLELMASAACGALGVERQSLFLKTRKRLGLEDQYDKVSSGGAWRTVRENGLSFRVNLSDYLDTGLFMDHRPARAMVRGMAAGKRVLNLFCYTGSFSVYALAGGAERVVGVDLSNTYLQWARDNVEANGLDASRYEGVRSDVAAFLAAEKAAGRRYDLVVLDPPTFSNSKRMEGFLDIVRHWPALTGACLDLAAPGGVVLFSSNAKALRVGPESLPGASVEDISAKTVPEDYRGLPHRTWLLRRA